MLATAPHRSKLQLKPALRCARSLHSEDVGVICNNAPIKLRLVGGPKGSLMGRLEVLFAQEYGTVSETRLAQGCWWCTCLVSSALLAHPCSFVPSTFAPFAKLALGPLHCLCPGLRLGIVWGQGGLRCMPAHGPAAACQGDLRPVWAGPQDPAHLDVKRQMHRQRAATGPVQAQRLGHSQLHTRQRCWCGLQLQWASVSQESRGRVAAEAQDTVQLSVQFLFSPPSFHSTGAWSLSHEPAGYPALHVCTSHFRIHVSSFSPLCPRERAGAPPSAALHAEGCRPFMICTLMHCEAAA